jgi:hypothetical protein
MAEFQRDPARILAILAAVGMAWEHWPAWRLGQLLQLAADRSDAPVDERDLHLIEDVDLLRGLSRIGGQPSE